MITTMPESTIIPVLSYSNLDEAITWLLKMGFKERWRIKNHRAQLSFGNGTIAVTEGVPNHPASLMVRVTEIDKHYSQSLENGISILSSPEDHFYGERQYTVRDVGGNQWTFSETVNEMTPEDWGAISAQ